MNNKNIFFLFTLLAFTAHIHGCNDKKKSTDLTTEDFISIKLTEEDKQALENINSTLIEASKQSNFSNMHIAILQGANVNYQDETGNTANHHVTKAISEKSSLSWGEMLEYGIIKSRLYEHGASDKIPNNNGITVEDINNDAIRRAHRSTKK